MPISNIFPKIYDFDNLYQSYLEARKGKRYRKDVLEFSANLEENLIEIQNELIWKTYRVGPYHQFYIQEPKKRLIMALKFRDRVVQWAIYRQLNPMLDRQFISESYGCRVGKGMHRAVERLQGWMRLVSRKPGKWYYLKLDISKYFYRIDHQILMAILRRKIKDESLLWLLGTIINSEDTRFGLPLGESIESCPKGEMLLSCGVPIGNLTSQMFANLYLNELDQYAKHELKIHFYVRYMDDIIILYPNKQALQEIKDKIERFLRKKLSLSLNKKTAVRPVSVGVEFVGFKIYITHKKLKNQTARKIKARIRFLQKEFASRSVSLSEIRKTMASYGGMMKYFNSFGLRRKISDYIFERRSEHGMKRYRWKWG